MDNNSNVGSSVSEKSENKLIPMKCPGCGATLNRSEGNKRDYFFCEYCGTKIQVNDTVYIHDDAEIIRAEYESKLAELDIASKKQSNAFFKKRILIYLIMTVVGIVLICTTPDIEPLTFTGFLGALGVALFVIGALCLVFGTLIHLPGIFKNKRKLTPQKFRIRNPKFFIIGWAVMVCMLVIGITFSQTDSGSNTEINSQTRNYTENEIHQLEIDADNGDRNAQFTLGCCYFGGDSVIQNYTKAFEYLSLAANQGDDTAQVFIGYMYLVGLGVPADYNKAFELFSPLADKNNAEALLYLGNMYEYGQGVTQNLEKAADYYRRAEENGHPDAHQYLANIS